MLKQIKTLALSASFALGLALCLVAPAQAAKKEVPPAAVATPAPAPAVAEVASVQQAPAAQEAIAPVAHSEVEDNPYGLGALWAQGDIVAKGTLLILVIMSMGSWYVIVTKFFEQSKVARFANAAQKEFWSAGSVRQGTDKLSENSPFRFIAEKGLEGASKHDGMLGAVDFNTWVTMSIQRAINNVQSRTPKK